MYVRRSQGEELTFDFALGLIHDNLLISDRETNSLWSQLHGKAIAGPRENEALRMVASVQTTWRQWKKMHPASRIGMTPDDWGRAYWYRDPGKPEREPEHDTTALGLGFSEGTEAIFIPLSAIEDLDYPLELGGKSFVLHGRPSEMTAWIDDAAGQLVTTVMAYESGWRSFFPDTEVFVASP